MNKKSLSSCPRACEHHTSYFTRSYSGNSTSNGTTGADLLDIKDVLSTYYVPCPELLCVPAIGPTSMWWCVPRICLALVSSLSSLSGIFHKTIACKYCLMILSNASLGPHSTSPHPTTYSPSGSHRDFKLTQASKLLALSPQVSPPFLLPAPPSNQSQATNLEATLESSLPFTFYILSIKKSCLLHLLKCPKIASHDPPNIGVILYSLISWHCLS